MFWYQTATFSQPFLLSWGNKKTFYRSHVNKHFIFLLSNQKFKLSWMPVCKHCSMSPFYLLLIHLILIFLFKFLNLLYNCIFMSSWWRCCRPWGELCMLLYFGRWKGESLLLAQSDELIYCILRKKLIDGFEIGLMIHSHISCILKLYMVHVMVQ